MIASRATSSRQAREGELGGPRGALSGGHGGQRNAGHEAPDLVRGNFRSSPASSVRRGVTHARQIPAIVLWPPLPEANWAGSTRQVTLLEPVLELMRLIAAV